MDNSYIEGWVASGDGVQDRLSAVHCMLELKGCILLLGLLNSHLWLENEVLQNLRLDLLYELNRAGDA